MKSSFLKKALPHIIAVLIFWVVSLVYCKPALEGKVVRQIDVMGYKGMAQQSLEFKEKYGYAPLWTESTFSGMPTYNIYLEASLKFLVGNLSSVLTLGMPKPISFFLLACVTFYFLSMVMGLNSWLGVLAALGYAWSTFDPILVAVGHDTQILAMGYAPGLLASLILIYKRQYIWGAVLLAAFTSMQMNTEHFQVVYYTMISAGLLTIFYAYHAWKTGQLKGMILGVGLAIVAAGIGAATVAVLILPVQDIASETMRGGRTELTKTAADSTKPAPTNSKGLDREYAFSWSYGIAETFTLAVPRAAGGGSDGKELGEDSKMAEKLSETFGMPQEQAAQYASSSLYWGAQDQGTAGPVYLGAVFVFLFILGLVFVKGWSKWWLLTLSIVGIVLAWGKNLPAVNYFLFDHLPMYNKFRSPTFALIFPQFAFPLLGALGLQALLSGSESKQAVWKKFRTSVAVTGALLILIIGYYFMASYNGAVDSQIKQSFQNSIMQSGQGRQAGPELQAQATQVTSSIMTALREDRKSAFGSDLIRSVLLIALTVVLIGLYLKEKYKMQQILFGGLIFLGAFDLLSVGLRYLSEEKFVEAADFESALQPTAADLQIKQDKEKGFRVFNTMGSPFALSAESARTSYNHNNVGGYSPAKLGLFQDLYENQLGRFNLRVYNMLNTKYIIQEDPQTRQPVAHRNPDAYGPAWLVRSIHYVADGNEEMKALDSVNTRDTVLIQSKFKAQVKFEPVPDSTASITLIDNLLDKINYKFSAKTNQFAVFSEIYYPKGWKAFIDGQETDILRVDYLLRGICVPAGDHNIEFRFEPHSFIMGDRITTWTNILVFLGLIAAIAFEWRKRTRKA